MDDKGYTPLFYAIKENAFENILDLLEIGGADPNHEANNGKTPLYKAHSYDCTLLLLQYKAESFRDRSSKKPRKNSVFTHTKRADTAFAYLIRFLLKYASQCKPISIYSRLQTVQTCILAIQTIANKRKLL